ncbi:DNA-binding GntR family transcriptional regulator [Solibacillus kalamii]|uniref:GntR family transcriptional regulator n=2 Tax=Solibacillus TaxID=648800 RepID=A0ABX3ZC34_9BACL|nr:MULTISPECIES: GntR family transcriptional regulator [Solibacillus]AMO87437.1 transcriptional regulator [Solibacillus silvestris]EKB43526.1 putative HTH-type transcriptional regulator ydfH [Solibacillus isronensis B3W22]MBM7667255.1 DNA-binding GntR family transcriptional regulator [Solibacillus kalamii]OUZ37310.1 GntR family transcriptional regulator [Solibacillus kalamii]
MKFDHDLTAETLPSKIYRILREAIIKGQLQPGERLVQDELAKTLNVSRMPIREAIKQLAAEGYVTVEPHKGAVVKQFTIHELEEIYFLRAKFEPLAAAESLKTMSPQLVNQLRDLNEKMKKTDDTDEYIQLNIQFHHLLIKDCPWGKLNNIIENLWTGFPQQTPHLLPNQIATSISEHDLMVEALANNNIELTCQLLEQHITRAKYDVLKNFIQ